MGQRNVQPGCNTAKLPFQNTYQTSSEAEVKRDEFFAVVEVAIVQQDLHVLQSGFGCLALRALHGRSRRLRELLSFRKFNCQWTTASFDFHQMAVHKRTTMLAHCNLKQNLCSKQSSFFPFMHCPLVASWKTRWSIALQQILYLRTLCHTHQVQVQLNFIKWAVLGLFSLFSSFLYRWQ